MSVADQESVSAEEQYPLKDTSELRKIVDFLSLKTVYCLVDQSRFKALPQQLQAYGNFASLELLSTLGTPVANSGGEFFLFSSESIVLRALRGLKEDERYRNLTFTPIQGSPVMFIEHMVNYKPTLIHCDMNCSGEFTVQGEHLSSFQQLMLLVRLAGFDLIYIIEDEKKKVVELELEGKTYAFAFFTDEVAGSMLEGLRYTHGECTIAGLKTSKLIKEVLNSPFEGLVFNPASATQKLIKEADLRRMGEIREMLDPPGLERLKDAFSQIVSLVTGK